MTRSLEDEVEDEVQRRYAPLLTENAQLQAEVRRLSTALAETRAIVAQAGGVARWVGPGDPDLDDPEERKVFMADIYALRAAWLRAPI